MKNYFYKLLASYVSFYIPRGSRTLVIEPAGGSLLETLKEKYPDEILLGKEEATGELDYIILSGNLHHEPDILAFLDRLKDKCSPHTRLIVTYYSSLWRPLYRLAKLIEIRDRAHLIDDSQENWLSPSDIGNLLKLAGFEVIQSTSKILLPLYVPLLSTLLNRCLAPLPFFRLFSMLNIAVTRIIPDKPAHFPELSVSVVVAARNESGNIQALFDRMPTMGLGTEVILVEGNSTDDTWEKIQEIAPTYSSRFKVITAQQDGKGKGDAVRKGFGLATGDIFMILDADLTVPPEDLPKFYATFQKRQAEFINGSRLVYPMEGQAMRFFNLIANKFFAAAFSFLLGQALKDTLCGTKVFSRRHAEIILNNRDYFGDFDPFGDFDLLFGASRLGLKIVEVPIRYRNRVYGETNISRWTHGLILLRMVIFAARRIKFV